ncbi:maleylpyruvate isomerase family mycothiol-dependent enzyme [Actinoplanes sp. NPDC051343]|uniref:maleylpyruvate isomerase family mycothiol-dependent enzyme n=1 Tax=Actinoplanes sp. NPDC051343 TaxID=3363906 RepID=UPI0037B6F503
MTSLADQVIAALRSGYDDLAAYAAALTDEELTAPSGASEWNVSQVLSHLGSGAEINQAAVERARTKAGSPPDGFNQGVWARWDAMGPVAHRDAFIAANGELVALYESLTADERRDLRVDLGFLPAPISVGEAGRMRLNEFSLHTWDAKVGADPATTVPADAVPLLFDAMAGLLGWIAKPDALGGRSASLAVVTSDPSREFGLELGEKVALSGTPAAPDGTLRLPAEAWLRLITGRLAPEHTPAGVEIDGPLSLDDLRKVFPGF